MPRTEPVVVHEDHCPIEGWEAAEGGVQWRTLLSADRTPTASITLGVATLGPDPSPTVRLHRHAQPEVYYILSGEGVVAIDGTEYPVRAGSAVFIPGNADHGAYNTHSEPLRLLYAFPADSFSEIEYVFPDTPS